MYVTMSYFNLGDCCPGMGLTMIWDNIFKVDRRMSAHWTEPGAPGPAALRKASLPMGGTSPHWVSFERGGDKLEEGPRVVGRGEEIGSALRHKNNQSES